MEFINHRCVLSPTDKRNTKSETVSITAEDVLAQREKDVKAFMERKEQVDTLIKMIAKVTESITGICLSVSPSIHPSIRLFLH